MNPSMLGIEEWMILASDEVLLSRGDYATYIERWESFFPPEQMLYIPFQAIKKNPNGLLRRVEHFIGLNEYNNYGENFLAVHATKKIHIPDFVKIHLMGRVKGQYEFLEDVFTPDFMKMI